LVQLASRNKDEIDRLRRELEDRDRIIEMYENVLEYSRLELIDAMETLKARESVSDLSRQELLDAMNRIRNLERKNAAMVDRIRELRGLKARKKGA
jgi:glycyl-tRNA synthetase beta subunit